MRNFLDACKRHFAFTKKERNEFLIVVLAFALIISFNDWGTETFDLVVGLRNFLAAIAMALIGVFSHHAAQRLVALSCGVKLEHKVWWTGLLFGIGVLMLTNGQFWVLAATTFTVHAVPGLRLGKPKHELTLAEFGRIALAGPAANLILAAILGLFSTGALGTTFFLFNLALAAYNLLPIPPLDGVRVFFASRLTYVFAFSTLATYALLSLVLGISSLLLSIIVGAACWTLFYFLFERTA